MKQDWNNVGLVLGAILMMVAISLTFATVAGGQGLVLIAAVVCTLAADGMLLMVCRHSGRARRVLSILLMMPTLLILVDVVRREPFVRF